MTSIRAFDLQGTFDLLARTPALLDAWLRDLPSAWLSAREGDGSFSPFDVLGHLLHGERTDWVPRARHILEQRPEPFEPFDRFAQQQASRGHSTTELLEAFQVLRAENLHTMRALQLSDRELRLTGRHPELGVVTLRQLLATWVVHDQGHLAQIGRVLAKRLATEVGPWEAYLPVLGDRPG